MKYKKTDNIISEKYLSVEPEFDAESVWSQLEPKIKRKKRRGVWLWFATGVSLVVLLAYYQLSVKDTANLNKPFETLNDQNIDTALQMTDLSNQDIKDSSVDLDATMSTKYPLSSNLNTYNENSNIKQSTVNTKNSTSTTLLQSEKNESNLFENNTQLEDALGTNLELISSSENKTNKSMPRTIKSFDILNTGLNALEYDRQILALVGDAFMNPIAQNSIKKTFRLGVYGGYFIHSRSFQHSGVGLDENYISRVNEEDAMDAFDLGLKLDYFITNNLVVFGGLRFDNSYVERNADYVYLESITIEDHTIVIIETEEGTTEETGSVTYDGFYHHKSNNYLTSKRIGFLAGLQYRIGKGKWSSNLNLGVELPIWSNLIGVITNDGKPYNLSEGTLDINKRQPLIFGGVGGEYALLDGIGLQVMIGGYLPMGNEYKESYNIIKKSTQLGINLGIHFQL